MTIAFYRRRYGVSDTITFPLRDPATGQFVTDAAHVSGDVTLTKDEGTPATFTAGFADEGQGYSISYAFGDAEAKRVVFEVVDQSDPKAWIDAYLCIETEGDELSQHNRTPGVLLETTINVVTDDSHFTITTGTNDNNTLLNSVAFIIDASSPDSPPDRSFRNVTSYTGSTKAVVLESDADFPLANGDKIIFIPTAPVASVEEIVDAIFDEAKSGHTTADTFGKIIQDIETDVAAVQAVVDSNSGDIGQIDAKVDLLPTAAEVNAEVVDVLTVDTITLPGQAAPPATPTFREAIAWLFKALRNKKTQTTSLWSLFDDAGTTVDAKATVSDAAGTTTKEEIVTGP